jgi:hypothetical protein
MSKGKNNSQFKTNAMKKLIDYFTPTTKDDAELGKAMLIITGAILIIIYLAAI